MFEQGNFSGANWSKVKVYVFIIIVIPEMSQDTVVGKSLITLKGDMHAEANKVIRPPARLML